MIFSVSNNGIEWSLDFGPDSATLTVKDLVHEMTIRSQDFPLAAWSLLLNQRQEFLNNHPAWVPVTANQQGTHEMRNEVLSSVGVQGLDTNGYPMSDLDDVEFYCKNDQLDVDALFKTSRDIPFSPPTFNNFEMGSLGENPIFIDEEQDMENSPPNPLTPVTTAVFERPTQSPVLMRSHPFATTIENVPDYIYRNWFKGIKILLLCTNFNENFY